MKVHAFMDIDHATFITGEKLGAHVLTENQRRRTTNANCRSANRPTSNGFRAGTPRQFPSSRDAPPISRRSFGQLRARSGALARGGDADPKRDQMISCSVLDYFCFVLISSLLQNLTKFILAYHKIWPEDLSKLIRHRRTPSQSDFGMNKLLRLAHQLFLIQFGVQRVHRVHEILLNIYHQSI